jgi:hypothetical protein
MTKVMSKTKGSIKSTIPSIRFSGGPKRLPDESTPAYRAFRVYLNQGPGRTLDLAWQFYCLGSGGKQHVSARRPGHWSRWSARHQWVDRAAGVILKNVGKIEISEIVP